MAALQPKIKNTDLSISTSTYIKYGTVFNLLEVEQSKKGFCFENTYQQIHQRATDGGGVGDSGRLAPPPQGGGQLLLERQLGRLQTEPASAATEGTMRGLPHLLVGGLLHPLHRQAHDAQLEHGYNNYIQGLFAKFIILKEGVNTAKIEYLC